MREIKFRSWNPNTKTMLHFADWSINTGPNTYLAFEKSVDPGYSPDDEGTPEKDSLVLMQFTGLLDTDGVEIFEGDIMRHLANYPRDYQEMYPHKKCGFISGPIEWSDGYWFIYKTDDNRDILLTKKEAESYEVVGNVYENSDLLK